MKFNKLLIFVLFIAVLLSQGLMREQVTAVSTEEYSDVVNHWSNKFVVRLTEKGIFEGYTDDTFKPDNNKRVFKC